MEAVENDKKYFNKCDNVNLAMTRGKRKNADTYDQVDDYEPDECYQDEDDEFDDTDPMQDHLQGQDDRVNPSNELVDLSRQSMVPLHELIAYYQYIQQGSTNASDHDEQESSSEAVSRQSSSASQETTKYVAAKFEPVHDTVDTGVNLGGKPGNQDETPIVEASVVRRQVANFEAIHSGTPSNKDSNQHGNQHTTIADDAQATANKQLIKRRVRANVILELINSERDFVKHLKDVVEGYLYPARRHPEIFTGERINTIFANIEQLYEFQRKFLESLEECINWQDLASSKVGRCFLDYEKGFSVYHYYCNNHPNATSELQDLYTKQRFVKFFEACRVLQNMIDISLDGFLLTPIQKICKYPLQLNELLKHTDKEHEDYDHVMNALETMRNCANLANERKRRIEALAEVMSFQERIENWFGAKLCDTSSILVHSSEVMKMGVLNSSTSGSVGSCGWSQGVQLFLFDHLLLYLKKDLLLKRSSLVLKGRICMDSVTEISDADEYKPKRSFKLYCGEQEKWFIFVTRTEREKDEWIQAFERERNLVEADENEGFHITDREISIARRALQHRKHSRSARYRHKQRPDTAIVDQIDLDDANMIMNRTLSLPSCIHPSHVMNFVEDSKVISKSNKGGNTMNTSLPHSPGSKSPGSQQQQHLQQTLGPLDEQPGQQTTGNWFKKMGSKKLAKSQVYTINRNSHQSVHSSQSTSSMKSTVSPSSIASTFLSSSGARSNPPAQLTSAQTITSDKAAIKYEELEKRHREHMISEEQARLYWLNNDLPPPPTMFSHQPSASGSASSARDQTASRWSGSRGGAAMTSQGGWQSRMASAQPSHTTDPRSSYSNSSSQSPTSNINIDTNLSQRIRSSLRVSGEEPREGDTEKDRQERGVAQPSFEATLMLSSGRLVKVREDAV